MAHRRMFVTDLDNTLVGEERALRRLIRLLERQRGVCLVYATGRSYPSVLRLCEEQRLPMPDCVAARVGTMIYYPKEGTPGPDPAWQARISGRWSAEAVRALAGRCPELEAQPVAEQDDFKCSYFCDRPALERVTAALDAGLEAQGFTAGYVFSSHRNLDIVPAEAGKGPAVEYLLSRHQLRLSDTLVCGDSGNDISMLLLRGCHAIAVGNSSPELLEAIEVHARHVYRAKSPAAAGILEGIDALGFFRR